jgi:[acyl-carrier-protein] S-malonyltransferase
MSTAFLFPGQGAQHVGMAKELHDRFEPARTVFRQACDATGLDLETLCFEGPEEDLARTDIAQPAIFTVSAAMLAVLDEIMPEDKRRAIQPSYFAGLSLGEYTALYAADALDFTSMVKLVARRGELMQQAATAVPSGMVSVLGIDEEQARELVAEAAGEAHALSCANFNCPGQIVLSGQAAAVERAAEIAPQHGASGAIVLKVAGAFHSELMAPAAEKFADALGEIEFAAPSAPVLSNVDAEPHGDSESIKKKLLAQLTSPVRWQQCMEKLLENGVETFYEIGPGRVLAGLMRRIHRRADFTSLKDAASVEKLAATE